jgi:hypothetical protein
MVGKRFRSDKERDPIAELARLIAQADTDEESAPSDSRFREETVSNGYDETPELPPAPQLAVDLNEHDQACERDEYCSDDQAYDVDDELDAAEEEYQDREAPPHTAEEGYQNNEVMRVRRHSPTLLTAIVGLALIGTACAVSHRDMFGGSGSPGLPPTIKAVNEPNRIVPAPSVPRDDLDVQTFAFEILHNKGREDAFPRKNGAGAWFDFRNVDRYEIFEQSFPLPDDEVLTVLTIPQEGLG